MAKRHRTQPLRPAGFGPSGTQRFLTACAPFRDATAGKLQSDKAKNAIAGSASRKLNKRTAATIAANRFHAGRNSAASPWLVGDNLPGYGKDNVPPRLAGKDQTEFPVCSMLGQVTYRTIRQNYKTDSRTITVITRLKGQPKRTRYY